MPRLILLSLTAVLALATGCVHGVLIPARNADGSGAYGDPPKYRKDTVRYIPTSLLSIDFFSQAQACAVAHNRSDDVGRSCGTAETLLTAGQLTSAGLLALSAGVSGRVESDVAKRHWEYAGLGATAALAALTGFDAWLNCSERTWAQRELAAEQLARLQNAGRLVTCGNEHAAYEESLRKARAALDPLRQRANKNKAYIGAPPSPPLAPDTEIIKGVEELEKALENPASTSADVRAAAAKVSAPITVAAAVQDQASIDAERAQAGTIGKEVAPLKATLCRDVEKTVAGEKVALRARDYMDAAHRELVECLTPRFTRFNANTAGTPGTP